MNHILLAGSTGYLGGFILQELLNQDYPTRIVVRNVDGLPKSVFGHPNLDLKQAQVTKPESLAGCCKGIDAVISSVGITRQKDGLTYMDVDYQANLNLLREAQRSGVKKFIYVSVFHGEKLGHIAICRAKERFVAELKASGMDYCIVRPNGFFSDLEEFYQMAKQGRVYLFGDGQLRITPIHGADLAKACVEQLATEVKELNIGGPETLSHHEIAEAAFAALGKAPKITHLPDWLRRAALSLGRVFMSKQKFGPVEFFMTAMALDMASPEYGEHTLREHFEEME